MEKLHELHELNKRLRKNGRGEVFEMNALNDKLKDLSPIEILMRAEGYFSTHDDYFERDILSFTGFDIIAKFCTHSATIYCPILYHYTLLRHYL